MSKYLYVIIPVLAMAAFVFYYTHESRAMEIERAKQQAIAEQKAKEEEAHMEALREKSKEEARIAAEKRAAEQKAKDDKKEADFQESLQALRNSTAEYVAEQNKSKAQIADLEAQLAAIRADKENLSRQSIDMNQSIVSALIERQTAEMEVQRFAAMVAQRATNSPMTRAPVVAAPAPAQ